MSINKINMNYFSTSKNNEENNTKVVFSNNYIEKISFVMKNKFMYSTEYSGFKLIKTMNTNKAIKQLLYNDNYNSFIKINDIYVKQNNIIIISPFTRISDVLSSKVNGNLHNFLKEKDLISRNNKMEEFIVQNLNEYNGSLDKLINYNLSKCDLINYIDIKNDFIDSSNIKEIFDVLINYDDKKLIIFNDVDYLNVNDLTKYLNFFNFLYFVNSLDKNYETINNYYEFMIDYDYLNNSYNIT